MKPRAWYRIAAQAAPDVAELFIFDEIGASFWNDQAVTAKQFIADLRALPESVKTLRVHVNSPGGDPFDATAIANALRAQRQEEGRTVEVTIEGLAASAATIVTSAGQPIRIADNAIVMIHDPFAVVLGPAADMRKMADTLDTIRDSIIATYRWVSDLSAEALSALMTAETWMDASEAVKNGFATEIIETVKVSACFRPDVLARLGAIPEVFRPRVEALIAQPAPPPTPPPAASPAEVIRACKAAGCPELAEDLLGQPMAAVTARLAQETAARAERESRATEIRALCGAAKLPELADGYVRGAMPAAEVRAHLTTLTALLDRVEIDGHLPPDPERVAATRAALNPAAIYAERNRLGRKE